MKTKCSFILKTSVALLLAILMVFGSVSTVIAAVVDVSTGDQSISTAAKKGLDIAGTAANADLASTGAGQYNLNWQAKKVYFVVPDSWDLSTYSHVQVDITRTTSATNSNHQEYIATMTRVGTSRLYQATINANHNGWNQNEFLAFTANDHDYGSGSFKLNGNVYYTTPVDYGMNNSSNYYLALPGSDANGCTVSMGWNANRDTLMKKAQKANVYTDKASSSTGGSVSLTGYYFSSDTAITSSSSSSSYDSVLGTTMTMTATANTGYAFDGWYSNSACTTKLSSDATYSYTVTGAKTVYANFTKLNETYTNIAVAAKGSTDGSTFNTTLSGTPATISANSYTTGSSALNISAGTVSGYTFYKWVVTAGSGTIGSATTASTTFTPSKSNTTVTAQYKKNYTITSSVDNTGTGAGTVTTSKTSVEAGGSYTITATPKSGSAIESIKVNNGTGTTTSPRTVSSVSADQTVVVKFAAKPHVIGKVAAAGWTKPGDAMTSNADGTEFTYTRTELAAGTYDFQHYIGTGTGGTYDSTSTDIATKTISGGATLSSVDNGYGGKKFQLVLTAKSDVTLVSNGSKFTAITVRRSGGTKYNVTFKKAANTTITGQYEGTNFSTASADATVQVYEGDEISFTVTAASGYHISNLTGASSPTFSPVVSDYKITNVTAAKTVTPTAAADVNITAKTNKSSRGTVTVNKNKSFKGDTVKITVTPLAGSLKTLTATYVGSGKTYEYKNSDWAEVQSTTGSSTNNALLGAFLSSAKDKFALAPTGAETDEAAIAALPDLAPVGAAQTIDMVMQDDSAVTINAVFDTYSADSTWYYNGYDTSGNAVSGYHSKQMTESYVSGELFSYYHVEGRTGTDQLMTVSNGAASSGTRYIYFTASAEGGWSTDENHQYAYFYNDSGNAGNAWPGYKMTKYTTNEYGQNVYRVEIPTSSSPTGVVFNNASNAAHKTTNVTDLSKGGYYLLSTHHSDNGTEIHDWQSYDCTYPSAGYSSGTEYFYGSNNDVSTIYSTDNNGKSIFGTTGFYRHGTNNKNYAKPRLTDSDKGDYYVNVLYPGKTYTINGVTKTIGTDPVVIWSKDPLAGDDENVTVYAKDGAIRGETFGSTYANIADTKIYAANGTTTVGTMRSGSIENQTYETYKAAKGDTLVIKTQIGATDSSTLSNAADLKAKYYVRGFCVNGEVSELLEWNANGLYTLTYKIPEDTEITKFEITPIYYLKDTTANPIVTYRVTGFTDELKQVGSGKPGWGDTLYTYPYYGKLGGDSNAFGAYPGQPMVYYKGQYQMQIPQKSTTWVNNTSSKTTVSGVTMSNGYWDSVHRQIMGYGNNSTSADHVQTYDYGDFYKIFNEKKPVDNIVFDFKYRTNKHNLVNDKAGSSIAASSLTSDYGTNGNGFEMLTNFHGKNVDLFGNPLSGDAANPDKTTPIYVVSIGGVNDNVSGVENIAGYYATEWRVYAPNTPTSLSSTYKKVTVGNKSSIPPEVLVLNNDDNTSFNTTTYPSADENHNVTDWQAMYTELKQYAGHPVMISYEAADAQQGQGMYYTGTGGATRNDGRWLYSKNGENITSNIRIDVSHDSGATYVENPASGESSHVDGLSAYFTNADAYQKMTYSTTIDPDKTFDFEAKTTNASYKFVGWYMADGTKITSDNVSHTERSGSYTFVARFMEVSSGQLTLSHSVDTGAEVEVAGNYYTCDGSGTAKIGAVVTDAETNEVLRTFDLSSSDITIPEKYIGNDKNYNITVTLEATADTNTAYGTSKLANTDESSVTEARFFNPKTPTTSGKTTTYTFTFNVKDALYNGTTQRTLALTYHSYFIQYKFNYAINYTFDDRNGKTKQYKRIGTLTPGEANTYVKKVDSSRYLDKSFIEKMAPYESNFGQDITWNFEDYQISTSGEDGSNYEYNINAHYTATQTNLNKRNITFVLPYQHNNGVAVMTDGVGTKDTTRNLELIAVTDEDGKITQDNRVDFNTIPVLPNNGENGIFTEEGKKNWIAAPATIKDGNSVLNFQYWSVKPTDRAGENDPDVARCYFQGFNFVAYDNYIITPVYGASTVVPSDFGKNTNITYVETNRNQWNTNGTDYDYKTQKDKAADLLYNDFIVAYNYDGKDIFNGDADSEIAELGVVVERIQKLEIKDDGTYDTTLSRYTGIETHENEVDKVINGTSTEKNYTKHAIATNNLDNKNRIQFYNGVYNTAGWKQNTEGGTPTAYYTYKNYVYRAYSYMKLINGTIIKSAVPAYFTMYDVATADAADM